MSIGQEILVSELVGSLSMHFRRGEAAYQNFHADGRQFLFAKILRDNNCEVRIQVKNDRREKIC